MQIIKLKFRQTLDRGFFVTLSCSNQPWEVEGYLSLMPEMLKSSLQPLSASLARMGVI
ncbi:MAG: hypothetical protein AAGE96_20145 [Cyanobacteria bacterium P01_G01_bin.19]